MRIVARRFPTLFDRSTWRRAIPVAGAVATVTASAVAGAQQHQAHQEQQAASPLRIAPEIVVINPTTQTATLRLINTTNTWATADLTLQGAAPRGAGAKAAADSAKTDARARSLETWITKLPPQVMLSPHETLSVTLQFTIPKALTPGEYSAYVVAHAGERPTGSDGGAGMGLVLSGVFSFSTAGSDSSTTGSTVVSSGTPDTTKQSDDSTSGTFVVDTVTSVSISAGPPAAPAGKPGNDDQTSASTPAGDTRPFTTAKVVYRASKK